MMINKTRSGFTIIEILIGCVIFAMMVGGVYQIYSSIVRTHETGQWMIAKTTSLRNGLGLLRTEISRVVKPYKITQLGIEDYTDLSPEHLVLRCVPNVGANTWFETANFSADRELLKFFMIQPAKVNVPGELDSNREIMEGILSIKNKMIVYERVDPSPAAPRAASPTIPMRMVICDDPASLTITIEKRGGTDPSLANRNFVEVSIQARHPRYLKTKVTERVKAPFEVDAVQTLP